MPEELLVILGAEAILLVFVTAMTLRSKRMDVLSGLHRRAVSWSACQHSEPAPYSVRARAGALLSALPTWIGTARLTPANLWRLLRHAQSGLTKGRKLSTLVARSWRPEPPQATPSVSSRIAGARRQLGAR
ncbi:hypothetical protein I6F14_16205 [Bradyrhizobium sp. IC3069]|uniref:hypothetical protein n=1 Tax=Bradyrhizobium TaxID=374 RepID=UPI001CD7A45A|nr:MULTISPECIES: hypothetical protein [Bradyrhizobium]MCA1362890.1 hypothetical protein [Bradyrhizobium sp. IC4059]MCA1436476.1 hypothetical protein [Bradyrhizobium sp. BRP20]MCA1519533.1 hypothetical protein [Bradyrhizobium sp. IC3069]MCA1523513.1 hypothetical protein [Bradyrhizobium yuanmingense]MCA1545743.1 hypothetical protein [Bradyrhizobium sp. BRP19]